MRSAIIASAMLAAPAMAQMQPEPVVIGGTKSASILPEGTEIVFRTMTELSSKRSRVGDRFDLEVTEDVMLNGRVVIPIGSKGSGEVTKVTKKGMFGKSGKLETRLLYVRVGDRQVRINGAVGDRGKGGTAATVGAMVFVPVAGFFVTGTSALLPPGTGAVGTLAADLPVAFAEEAPAAVVVPGPVKRD